MCKLESSDSLVMEQLPVMAKRRYRKSYKSANISELRIRLLGAYGFYARTIQRVVKKYDGSEWSISHIYQVLKEGGIRLRDYREGFGDEAEEQIKKAAKIVRQGA